MVICLNSKLFRPSFHTLQKVKYLKKKAEKNLLLLREISLNNFSQHNPVLNILHVSDEVTQDSIVWHFDYQEEVKEPGKDSQVFYTGALMPKLLFHMAGIKRVGRGGSFVRRKPRT